MMSAPNDSYLLSNQDTNRFSVSMQHVFSALIEFPKNLKPMIYHLINIFNRTQTKTLLNG